MRAGHDRPALVPSLLCDDGCALRLRCTPNMPARKVTRSADEDARDMARDIATSDPNVTSRRQRNKLEMLFWHKRVNHAAGEYVSAKGVTTNGIEGFWSMLKRRINGTHIHVSAKHLSKYLAEFEYRHNMRQAPDLMLDRLLFTFPARQIAVSHSA